MLEFGKVKMAADARTREARSFLKAAQWRVLTMRSTSAGKGAEGAVPRFRMRVYAKGCPAHALREVHLLLNADSPLTDPVIDGTVQPGKWWHRGAGWSKDEGAGERGTGTCTLVRDLYDGEIMDAQFLEDGCGSRTKVIFYFDTPSVVPLADVPESGEQGFSVRIGGVSLDRETGLYSYYVTVTESKTLVLDEHKVAEDVFHARYDADYLGLRGSVDKPKDSGGEAVDVPAPGNPEPGVLITAQWSRNREDCTYNAQVAREVELDVDDVEIQEQDDLSGTVSVTENRGKVSAAVVGSPAVGTLRSVANTRSKGGLWVQRITERVARLWEKHTVRKVWDYFEHTLEERSSGVAKAGLPVIAEAGGGTWSELELKEREHGKWDVAQVDHVELDVDDVEIQEQDDLSGTVSVTENRGKSSAAVVGSPAVGTLRSVANTRSRGGLWVQRITERVARLWEKHTVRKVWNCFEHTLEERSSGVAKDDLPVIAEAGGGTWSELELKEREHGKWDVAQVDHVELDVDDAELVIERQALLAVEETESIGDDPLPDPYLAGEETPPYYEMGAGVTVRTHNSRTKGGKWRRRLRRVSEAAHSISYAASKHWGETADAVAGTSSEAASASLTGGTGGISERAESSPLPNGLYRVSKTTVKEANVSKSYDSADDYFSSAEVEEGIADSVEIVAETGKRQRVSASVTPGGKLRYSKTTETGKDAEVWTLVDKKAYGSYKMAGCIMDSIRVKLYANAELATAQADAAAFIAAHSPFEIITGTMTDIHNYFYYQHQVGFGLHVNQFGKWDGTLTLRAVLTPGMVYTVMAPPEE